MSTIADSSSDSSSASSRFSSAALTPTTLNPPADYDPELHTYIVKQTASLLGGTLGGLILGIAHGTQTGGLRFRAENAHRLPTTTKGWYLYHKSKNYYAMWAGLKEGGRMSVKLGFWTGLFVGVEESVNRLRRKGSGSGGVSGDALSTVCASLAIAGAFSAWNRFPLITAARTARMGLAFGAVYGVTQDAWRVFTGRRVGYVEAARKRFTGNQMEKANSMD